ncbi:hypothetical protein [Streptomyces sp. NPDC002547]
MLYDVTLPGNGVDLHQCPSCVRPFRGHYTRNQVDDWERALEQGESLARAHLEQSGAFEVLHTATCPLRCLPPAVLALCQESELRAQYHKGRAVLGDC